MKGQASVPQQSLRKDGMVFFNSLSTSIMYEVPSCHMCKGEDFPKSGRPLFS
jgi:hypothetical protein